MLFLDELAFMNEDFFMTTIMPLAIVAYVLTVGITTPKPRGAWFTEFVTKKKENGENNWKLHNFETICPSCVLKGEAAIKKCKCKLGSNTAWRSEKAMSRWEVAVNANTIRAELSGIASGQENLFNNGKILDFTTKFREGPKYNIVTGEPVSPPLCYNLYLDPNGGGTSGVALLITYTDINNITRVSFLLYIYEREREICVYRDMTIFLIMFIT